MPFPIDESRNQSSPEHLQLAVGQRLFNRRYELIEMLGPGGMGVVWKAHDLARQEPKPVALKFLPSILVHHEKEMKALLAEVDAGQNLRHDLIVATYGLEVEGPLAAIVLEFVAGETLKHKLEVHERGFFEPNEIESWLKDIITALTYLHEEKGVLHRDIKPANIIVDEAVKRARLMDFGISQSIQETMGRHTQTGAAQGTSNTLAYTSAESLGLRHKPAKTDDIYSLGATVYDLLTGTPPFYQGTPEIIALHIKTEPVPSVMQRRAELVEDGMNATVGATVPSPWQAMLDTCLAKDPAKRPQSVKGLDWRGASSEPSTPLKPTAPAQTKTPPPAKPHLQKPRRTLSQRLAKPLAAMLVVALLVGIPAYAWRVHAIALAEQARLDKAKHEQEAEDARVAKAKAEAEAARQRLAQAEEREKEKAKEQQNATIPPASKPTPTPPPTPTKAAEDTVTLTIQGKPKTFTVTGDPAKATKTLPYANKLGMLFVPIPGSKLLFCLHETRVQDFAAFVKATGHDATKDMASEGKDDTWQSPGFPQTGDHCVCGVSAEDADAFCAWLGTGCRLPTDHEWSLAVGGLEAEDGSADPVDLNGRIKDVYPWGTWPDPNGPPPKGAGNYAGEEIKIGQKSDGWTFTPGYKDGFPRTAPVCSFPPNANGLYDLGGNVWEWTSSTWEKNDSQLVLRGGCWGDYDRKEMLSSNRFTNPPESRTIIFGFRCVVVVAREGQPSLMPAKTEAKTDVSPQMPSHEKRSATDEATPQASKAQIDPDALIERLKTQGNSLGMKFVPLASSSGGNVFACIHETRSKDFAALMADGEDLVKDGSSYDWKGCEYKGVPIGRGKNERAEDSSHPVCNVRWKDAAAFCKWLTEHEHKLGLLGPQDAYRLPSDHEWSLLVGIADHENEQSTPANKSGGVPRVYPWGSTFPPKTKLGNYSDASAKKAGVEIEPSIKGYDDGFPTTSPVMSYPPNKLGIYDLGGNVWEWCSDWYDGEKREHVLRGSSWATADATHTLSSYRYNYHPGRYGNYDSCGFRCVLAIAGETQPRLKTPETAITTNPPSNGSNHVKTSAQNQSVFDLECGTIGSVVKRMLPGGVELTLCFCPHGSFTMGSAKGEASLIDLGEDPVNVAISNDFWMGQTEVTQAQWKALMETTPAEQKSKIPSSFKAISKLSGLGPNQPMYFVDWFEAQAFIEKLNSNVNLPNGWSFALPTEAEWEFACRAGSKGAFAFGNALSSTQANFNGDWAYGDAAPGPNLPGTCNVASFQANDWGLYDMHGNVWEWCWDAWNSRETKLPGGTNPSVRIGETIVIRGGCWGGNGSSCRSAKRNSSGSDTRSEHIGFRVALVPRRLVDERNFSSMESEMRRSAEDGSANRYFQPHAPAPTKDESKRNPITNRHKDQSPEDKAQSKDASDAKNARGANVYPKGRY